MLSCIETRYGSVVCPPLFLIIIVIILVFFLGILHIPIFSFFLFQNPLCLPKASIFGFNLNLYSFPIPFISLPDFFPSLTSSAHSSSSNPYVRTLPFAFVSWFAELRIGMVHLDYDTETTSIRLQVNMSDKDYPLPSPDR
jgi:hypothetical protein